MKVCQVKRREDNLISFNLYLDEGCIINGFICSPKNAKGTRSILAPRWPNRGPYIVSGNRAFWASLQAAVDAAVTEEEKKCQQPAVQS